MRVAYRCVASRKHYVDRASLLFCSIFLLLCACTAERSPLIFMNQFAVHIPTGHQDADEVASTHGFRNLGQVR